MRDPQTTEDSDLILSVLVAERERLTRQLEANISAWAAHSECPPWFNRVQSAADQRDAIQRVQSELARRRSAESV